jgi:hypothetical protein
MLRRALATFAMVFVLTASAGPAAALTNMGVTPGTQSHAHGVASNWTATWGGQPTFDELFSYGDGSTAGWILNTTLVSKNFSHTFYPCTGHTYEQEHFVHEDPTGNNGLITSHATEAGGNPC